MGRSRREQRHRRKAKKAKNLKRPEGPIAAPSGKKRFIVEVKPERTPSALLSEIAVDWSKPGFYDDPRFKEAEKTERSLLDAYADYVDTLPLSEEYLMRARRTVLDVATFMYAKLLKEGLKGACLDVAMTISRFLERQGIWNYVIIGGLTISFSAETNLSSLHIAPITRGDTPAKVGHSWLRAPPFKVVDIASSLQPYRDGEENYLPGVIAEESVVNADPDTLDLLDMDAARDFVLHYGRKPTLMDLELCSPGLIARTKRFGTFSVHAQDATLKYVSCGVSAPDRPFEQMTNIRLGGKYPIELYQEFMALRESRD